jgi:hypothetical protein
VNLARGEAETNDAHHSARREKERILTSWGVEGAVEPFLGHQDVSLQLIEVEGRDRSGDWKWGGRRRIHGGFGRNHATWGGTNTGAALKFLRNSTPCRISPVSFVGFLRAVLLPQFPPSMRHHILTENA